MNKIIRNLFLIFIFQKKQQKIQIENNVHLIKRTQRQRNLQIKQQEILSYVSKILLNQAVFIKKRNNLYIYIFNYQTNLTLLYQTIINLKFDEIYIQYQLNFKQLIIQRFKMEKNTDNIGKILIPVLLCMSCVMIPFAVCDLYYGYTDTCAVNLVNNNVSFTLSTWLLVDGYLIIALLIFIYILVFISCCNFGLALICMTAYLCINIFIAMFKLAWLIIGGVIFWKNLSGYQKCESLTGYMWANLIINILGILPNCTGFIFRNSLQSNPSA